MKQKLILACAISTMAVGQATAQLKGLKDQLGSMAGATRNILKTPTNSYSAEAHLWLNPHVGQVVLSSGEKHEGVIKIFKTTSKYGDMALRIEPFAGEPTNYQRHQVASFSVGGRVFKPTFVLGNDYKKSASYVEEIVAGDKTLYVETGEVGSELVSIQSIFKAPNGELTPFKSSMLIGGEMKKWLLTHFADYPEMITYLKETKDSPQIQLVFLAYRNHDLSLLEMKTLGQIAQPHPTTAPTDYWAKLPESSEVKIKKGVVSLNGSPYCSIDSKGNANFGADVSGTISNLEGKALVTYASERYLRPNLKEGNFLKIKFLESQKEATVEAFGAVPNEENVSKLFLKEKLVAGQSIDATSLELFLTKYGKSLESIKATDEPQRVALKQLIKRNKSAKYSLEPSETNLLRTDIYQDSHYIGYFLKDERAAELAQDFKVYVYAFNPAEKNENMIAKVKDGSRVVTAADNKWKKTSQQPEGIDLDSITQYLLQNGYL